MRNDGAGGGVPLRTILDCVRHYWGFDSLRPLQEAAIRATLASRDSVVVMPTGGGKSLCYQVPPVLSERTDVVVSPLISLMKDQVDGLRSCGYPAAALHSGLAADERDQALADLKTGRLRLLFVSPERLLSPSFLALVERLGVCSFAIDEAHCISHWGHDFRQEYRRLALLKERFPGASLHAYTATATQRVRDDIAAQLHLCDPAMMVGTFDRPNLTYRIIPRLDVHRQTMGVIRRHEREGTIVYCLSRRDTEEMAETLRAEGIEARAYHAGLTAAERRRTQDAFAAESLSVVTATVAFGMGIDRSNVRCVIHATMPKSVEHYQQETGRAGRDGLEAECVLFYSSADVMRWQSLIARSAAEAAAPATLIAAQTELLEDIRRYCVMLRCRHAALSEHFGQAYARANCGACDICLGETEPGEDATETAQKVLSCIARIAKQGSISFGAGHVIDVLLGARTESVRRWGHASLSTFGLLKGTPKRTLTNWVYQLVDQGLVERTTGERPTLVLNHESWRVMRGERSVRLTHAKAEPTTKSRMAVESWDGVDRVLFEWLRQVRRELAEVDGVPAYLIAGDRTLRELARRRPTRLATLRGVYGIGKAKLDRFGTRLVREIASYCSRQGVPTDCGETAEVDYPNRPRGRTSRTEQAAFDLFAGGATLDEVMAALGRARSTAGKYLCDYVAATRPASIDPWVNAAIYDAVARAAGAVGVERLKPIFDRLNGRVPYDTIKLVLTHLEVRDV